MVFGQRKINLAADLPDRAPPGFTELRREILGFAEEGEEPLLQVAGMQGEEEGEDPASSLFIVLNDNRDFPFARPFVPEVSFPFFQASSHSLLRGASVSISNMLVRPASQSVLRCEDCGANFEAWVNLHCHRSEEHGVEMRGYTSFPDNF
jgi:hypothetical protein